MTSHDIGRNLKNEENSLWLKYEKLLEAISSPIVILDFEGKIKHFNNSARLLTGFDINEIGPSLPLSDLLNEKDESIPKFQEKIFNFKEGSVITKILTKTGLYVPVELSITPYSENVSMDRFFIVQITDIRSSIELENKDNLLSAALSSSLDGMAILDRRLKITIVNAAFAEMLGTSEENLTGLNIFEIPQQALTALEKKNFLMTLKQSGTWRGVIGISRNNEQPKQIEIGIYRIKIEDGGGDAGFIAICRDVTEAEEQNIRIRTLSTQLKEYSKIIIKAMGISNVDISLKEICAGLENISDFQSVKIILFNSRKPYFVIHSATSAEELTVEPIINNDSHPQSVVKLIKTYEKIGARIFRQYLEIGEKKGNFYENRLWILLMNEFDKPIGLLTFINKNSVFEEQIIALEVFTAQFSLFLQIVKLQNILNVNRKEMEDFVYSVSHDLKTPVMSIVGFSDILLQKAEGKLNEEETHCLNRIEANVNLINHMVSSLLELSRAGKSPLEESKIISVGEIIESAKSKIEERYNIKLPLVVSQSLPSVVYDTKGLLSIFTNLFDNSFKFRKNDIPLHIEVGAIDRKEDLVFYVKDNGSGIPGKGKERIFEPFFRLCPKEIEGIGIGLSIVRKIVDAHNGEVWFESKEGEGSTFYFSMARK